MGSNPTTPTKSRRESRARPAPRGRARLLLLLIATLAACRTVDLVPEDMDLDVDDEVYLTTGRGVVIQSVGGRPVRARSARLAPGSHDVVFDFRRGLGDFDDPRIDDIYQYGTCRFQLEAPPGRDFLITTRIYEEKRETLSEEGYRNEKPTTFYGVKLIVIDETTDEVRRLGAEQCDLRLDCSRIDRTKVKGPIPNCSN